MSHNLTIIFYFFLQYPFCKNYIYFLNFIYFFQNIFVNGIPSVDRDVMRGAHGILGRNDLFMCFFAAILRAQINQFPIFWSSHFIHTLFVFVYKLQQYYTRSNEHYMCCWKTRYRWDKMGFRWCQYHAPPTFGSLIILKTCPMFNFMRFIVSTLPILFAPDCKHLLIISSIYEGEYIYI